MTSTMQPGLSETTNSLNFTRLPNLLIHAPNKDLSSDETMPQVRLDIAGSVLPDAGPMDDDRRDHQWGRLASCPGGDRRELCERDRLSTRHAIVQHGAVADSSVPDRTTCSDRRARADDSTRCRAGRVYADAAVVSVSRRWHDHSRGLFTAPTSSRSSGADPDRGDGGHKYRAEFHCS